MSIGHASRDRRSFAQALAVAALLVAAGAVAAAPALGPLTLRVAGPATVNINESRDISVMITNVGASPVLVLPNMVRLRIEGIGAEYVPYPGPPIDPWSGARELVPGEAVTVVFIDTSDRRGIWRLPPGNYLITAVYDVPTDLSSPTMIADGSRLLRVRLESSPASMNVIQP